MNNEDNEWSSQAGAEMQALLPIVTIVMVNCLQCSGHELER